MPALGMLHCGVGGCSNWGCVLRPWGQPSSQIHDATEQVWRGLDLLCSPVAGTTPLLVAGVHREYTMLVMFEVLLLFSYTTTS